MISFLLWECEVADYFATKKLLYMSSYFLMVGKTGLNIYVSAHG